MDLAAARKQCRPWLCRITMSADVKPSRAMVLRLDNSGEGAQRRHRVLRALRRSDKGVARVQDALPQNVAT